MSMKPLDELRSISDGCAYNEDDCRQWRSCREHRAQLLDAIEREIAERYVMLPVDADGVPWHIGDEALGVNVWEGERFTVGGIELTGDGAQLVDAETVDSIPCGAARHVQPDTWERIINDAFGSIEMNDEVRASFVARCRALAGEDE